MLSCASEVPGQFGADEERIVVGTVLEVVAIFLDVRVHRAGLELDGRERGDVAAEGEVRIDEVRVVVLFVHRGDRFAESRLTVEGGFSLLELEVGGGAWIQSSRGGRWRIEGFWVWLFCETPLRGCETF